MATRGGRIPPTPPMKNTFVEVFNFHVDLSFTEFSEYSVWLRGFIVSFNFYRQTSFPTRWREFYYSSNRMCVTFWQCWQREYLCAGIGDASESTIVVPVRTHLSFPVSIIVGRRNGNRRRGPFAVVRRRTPRHMCDALKEQVKSKEVLLFAHKSNVYRSHVRVNVRASRVPVYLMSFVERVLELMQIDFSWGTIPPRSTIISTSVSTHGELISCSTSWMNVMKFNVIFDKFVTPRQLPGHFTRGNNTVWVEIRGCSTSLKAWSVISKARRVGILLALRWSSDWHG